MLILFAHTPIVVYAATDAATAGGSVHSSDGAAVAGAVVTLTGNGASNAATSDGHGTFSFPHMHSGTYTLSVYAPGYNGIAAQTIEITADAKNTLELKLPLLQVSSLVEIGSVTANGSRSVSSLPAPTLDISMQPYAQQGETSVADVLGYQLSTTVVPVIGGGLNTPKVVSLRGPDASETLVDIDGHQVNNGNTGDFDLSLLDPADLISTQVVYGVAPSSLFGPNTLGGALNVRTLEPTAQSHALERVTIGSYNTNGETLQATGTVDRLGYAVSYHRLTSGGDQNGTLFPNTSDNNGVSSGFSPIGDSLAATSTIAKLRYSLWNDAGFVGISVRDQAVYRDLSSTLSSVAPGAGINGTNAYANFSGSSQLTHTAAYDVDLQAPIGKKNASGMYPTTAIYRHQTSIGDQTVNGPGTDTSPYLFNSRDLITDDTFELDHKLPKGELSARYALTSENLNADFIPGVTHAASELEAPFNPDQAVSIANDVAPSPLGMSAPLTLQAAASSSNGVAQQILTQTQRSLGLRYAISPTAHLHYTLAGYYSDYSTFGHSIDPRFGFVWTPKADTAYRFSLGSTFQSPQLQTFLVPAVLPPPVGGFISIGNPQATAERATSYDIGADHRLTIKNTTVHVGGDLYRTNLHNGVATFMGAIPCTTTNPTPAQQAQCLSYPVNVTQEVYQGIELHGDVALSKQDSVRVAYDIDSVYTQSYPANAADDVIPYEQALGVPLHKFTLDYNHDSGMGIAYYAGLLYEGSYNETNLGPFATLRAGATLHLNKNVEVELAGTNLTNVYAFKQTQVGAGMSYGNLSGPSATDAIPLAPRTVTLSITHRM